MKRFKYQALVTLYPPQPGGLETSLPAQTRCLVVRAEDQQTHQSKLFSSVVTADDGRPLRPGDACRVVTMQVNGDDAGEYVHPGEEFSLWFGTDVGRGVVSRQMFNWP
jgi:hypothetical protein